MSDHEAAPPVPAPSPQGDGDSGYDQRNVIEAKLRTCEGCGQARYFVGAGTHCGACREWPER